MRALFYYFCGMSNDYFAFKQFKIRQDGAAMKVGTDGVLLGAWTALDGTEKRVLDIGTGTGLIALMAAQRCPGARIDAVEIDESAARQAEENAQTSPWPERIHIHNGSIQDFARSATERYDHILSNPPFFVDSLKAPDALRSAARHTDSLPFDDLVAAVDALLAPQGRFSVIYPADQAAAFETAANRNGLHCRRRTRVRGTPEAVFKRTLMEFSRERAAVHEEELTIESARHEYTPEYIARTKGFYLKF